MTKLGISDRFFSILLLDVTIITLNLETQVPNGVRYPLVGGTRQHRFAGTSSTPRQVPENAQTPTSRVHAVLGGISITYK